MNVKGLQRVVDFCKNHGTSKLGIQLAHSGRKGSSNPPMNGGGALTKVNFHGKPLFHPRYLF